MAGPACILIWATDLRAQVAAIEVPCLVLHGDGDQNVPIGASGARMPGLVRHADLVVLEGARTGQRLTRRPVGGRHRRLRGASRLRPVADWGRQRRPDSLIG
ncbi:hypothetical protein G7085_02355 [Tessaracoccus sp. HDW20]|uniref:hypothetical protein n=1 Tax=Tessaracoccus coleopterorum TaxID=2714950 RepID=UPI0018D4246B|nr:hypothetical protein [Tessaracoccus coleopterorum]NHB83906.1 hypothetical protein [Tessaracoccus coleopterorum]